MARAAGSQLSAAKTVLPDRPAWLRDQIAVGDHMGSEGLMRRLSAVMVADVAGYSRLMANDEEGTHRRLEALRRALLGPAIGAHGGRLVKSTGDGVLAEFPSVVEATRCALFVQDSLARENAEIPVGQRIVFRIGINLGDVIVDDGDIYGDSVNVAARLEGLAEPGGIVVSRAVRDHVRGALRIEFDDMGPQTVKNIDRPLRTFRVRSAEPPRLRPSPWARWRSVASVVLGLCLATMPLVGSVRQGIRPYAPALATGDRGPVAPARLSIVVLPFAHLAATGQDDHLADGVTESLTTDLSRILPGSFVVSRGTASAYRGRPINPSEIGRDLKVRYLLQGSVFPHADRVRVYAQLVDTEMGREIWSERFDKMRKDILDVQDEIVSRLSRAIGLQVIEVEARRREREHPSNADATDLVMRGQAIANRPATAETMISARTLFQRALDLDPDNVDALAGLATTYLFEVLNSYYEEGRERRLKEAGSLLRRAIAADPRHIVALKGQAALLRAEGRFEEAILASRAVVALNPGEPWAFKEIGLNELYLGRFADAMISFRRAENIGPRDPSRWIWLGSMARVHFFLGQNDDAIRMMRLSAEANPRDPRAYALLAAIHAQIGRKEDAKEAIEASLALRSNMTIRRHFDTWSVPLLATAPAYREQHQRLIEGLRMAGLPSG